MSEQSTYPPSPPEAKRSAAQRRLMRRHALIDGIAVLFLALAAAVVLAADALMLVFGCILFAILLYELSAILHRRFGWNRKLALGVVVLLLGAIVGLGGWAMAPQISEQATELAREIPASIERLQQTVHQHPILNRIASELPDAETMTQSLGRMVPNPGLFFSGVLGAIGNVAIILFVGIYFALSPDVYKRGIVKLVPQTRRERAVQVMDTIGDNLARWLVGKTISMLIVGVATAVGLTLLGVPLGLILGIIAGLLDFIPYVGPIMAGVPAVLIALSMGPDAALYVVLLFLGVQTLEGYVLQPLVEARAVALPPALTIVMQLVFGMLLGFAGVALATPLTAVLMVLVNMLYIEDILGDRPERAERDG
ncbi:AI-2E family transporter [uncultured Massilia sp.]|uniref:AI-2E family transporter n=1 Tax=uncultured Massilia sp. TaxID=169973 RepID=UPI0025FE709D|nr:AI-2E family transporter [uncultured Massilia sp.]